MLHFQRMKTIKSRQRSFPGKFDEFLKELEEKERGSSGDGTFNVPLFFYIAKTVFNYTEQEFWSSTPRRILYLVEQRNRDMEKQQDGF